MLYYSRKDWNRSNLERNKMKTLRCTCGNAEDDFYTSGPAEFCTDGKHTRTPMWCGECEKRWWRVESIFNKKERNHLEERDVVIEGAYYGKPTHRNQIDRPVQL